MKLIFILGITAMLITGCASTSFTKTGDYEAKPREANCDFSLYTVQPPTPFKEVGLITFYSGIMNNVFTIDGIKATAKEYVCNAGGNGIILPAPTENGIYSRATVIWMQK